MNPTDFLQVAAELQAGLREADWRSAVSRAYYAAFHSALTMAMSCGVRFGKSSAAHDKLAMCLQHSGNLDVATAGAQLGSLRTARNDADYDLKNIAFSSSKAAAVQIVIAQQIVSAVQAKHADEQLAAAMRAYAKDVLGLVVVANN